MFEGGKNYDSYLANSCPLLKRIAALIQDLQAKLQFTHGDLNTANCMVTGDEIKLIDFGLSRLEINKQPIINSHEFNEHFRKGKDLAVFLWFTLYSIVNASPKVTLNNKSFDLLFLYTNKLTNFKWKLKESSKFYITVDKDESEETTPEKILEIDCDNLEHIEGGRMKVNTRKRLRNNSKTRKNVPLNSEFEIQEARSRLSAKDLVSFFKRSKLEHVSKHAELIASTYLSETKKDLQLNLLRTMLYFQARKEGAFEFYCKEYRRASPNAREKMINTIHWNMKEFI
jgi:serine/threonine protein kinase